MSSQAKSAPERGWGSCHSFFQWSQITCFSWCVFWQTFILGNVTLFKMDPRNLHVCVIIMERNDIFESTQRDKEAALHFDCSYFWNNEASYHMIITIMIWGSFKHSTAALHVFSANFALDIFSHQLVLLSSIQHHNQTESEWYSQQYLYILLWTLAFFSSHSLIHYPKNAASNRTNWHQSQVRVRDWHDKDHIVLKRHF